MEKHSMRLKLDSSCREDLLLALKMLENHISKHESLAVELVADVKSCDARAMRLLWNDCSRNLYNHSIFPSALPAPPEFGSIVSLSSLFRDVLDIAIYILQFIKGPKLIPLRRVCKRWKELIPLVPAQWSTRSRAPTALIEKFLPSTVMLGTSVDLPKLSRLKELSLLASHREHERFSFTTLYPQLTKLEMQDWGVPLFWITQLQSLKMLILGGFYARKNDFKHLLRLPHLQSLTLSKVDASPVPPSLTQLSVQQTQEGEPLNLAKLSNLVALSLGEAAYLSPSSSAALTKLQQLSIMFDQWEPHSRFPHITRLQICNLQVREPVNGENFDTDSLTVLTELRWLDLYLPDLAAPFPFSSSSFSRLEHLNIIRSRFTIDPHVPPCMPHLRSLEVSGITEDELSQLTSLQSIERLTMGRFPLNKPFPLFSRLTSLHVSLCLDSSKLLLLKPIQITLRHLKVLHPITERHEVQRIAAEQFPYLKISCKSYQRPMPPESTRFF